MVFILEPGDEAHAAANSQMRHWANTRAKLLKNRQRVRSMTAGDAERLRLSTIHETSAEEARERFAVLQARAKGGVYVD